MGRLGGLVSLGISGGFQRDRALPMNKGMFGDFGVGFLARDNEDIGVIRENPRGL